jgi:hypothetical protein
MTDFALDPLTRDLILPLRPVTGAGLVAQRIGIRLRCWLGEWFLDVRHGVPYLGGVLGKQPRLEMVEATLRAQILGVAGVRSIVSFSLSVDSRTRVARVAFVADTAEGSAEGDFVVMGTPAVTPRPPAPVVPPPVIPTIPIPGGEPAPSPSYILTDDGLEITDDNLQPLEY